MMRMFHEMGAMLIGTPSSQNENAPGWLLNYEVKNSKISGCVACKLYIAYSKNIDDGVYKVDHLLTYKNLKKYNFDQNTEILLALDLIKNARNK